MNLLLRTPLNVRVCVILMMHRLSARLSFIVVRRMSFVDQYFSCASGCRGVARCLHMAWAWPARGKSRGRAGDAADASIGRALPALLGAHVLHIYMCSEERYSECPGGLWRPGIGFSALLASYRGRAGMSSAQGRLKMRFSGRTKKFRVWPPCRHMLTEHDTSCVQKAEQMALGASDRAAVWQDSDLHEVSLVNSPHFRPDTGTVPCTCLYV